MSRFHGGLRAVLLTFRLREKLRRFQNESRTLSFDESAPEIADNPTPGLFGGEATLTLGGYYIQCSTSFYSTPEKLRY